jgi:hypothetical protein
MDLFDIFFKKFAYKFPKGYPDTNNEQDILLLENLLQGLGIDFKFDSLIYEVSDSQVTKNTRKATDYIIKNTNNGFKTQSDPKRLGNPNKTSSDDFKVIINQLFKPDDIIIHGPHSGPNPSGKYDMYEFETDDFGLVRIILSGGGNAGEQYETEFYNVAKELAGEPNEALPKNLQTLYKALNIDNLELTSDNIESFRTGDTKRNLDPKGPQDIGKTISDLDIKYGGKTYYISLKNKQGSGIYSGANIPWIYEKNEKVVYDSSKFDPSSGNGILFEMFNIDSKKIAKGLNDYINQTGKSADFQNIDIDINKFKKLLASSLGYGYYYVKEYGKGDVKVIPLLTAEDSLNAIGTITNTQIKYPSIDTKQVTIKIDTDSKLFGSSQYVIAIRNTSGKILPLSLRISKTK